MIKARVVTKEESYSTQSLYTCRTQSEQWSSLWYCRCHRRIHLDIITITTTYRTTDHCNGLLVSTKQPREGHVFQGIEDKVDDTMNDVS